MYAMHILHNEVDYGYLVLEKGGNCTVNYAII